MIVNIDIALVEGVLNILQKVEVWHTGIFLYCHSPIGFACLLQYILRNYWSELSTIDSTAGAGRILKRKLVAALDDKI